MQGVESGVLAHQALSGKHPGEAILPHPRQDGQVNL